MSSGIWRWDLAAAGGTGGDRLRNHFNQRLKAYAVAMVEENQISARGVMSFGMSVKGLRPDIASIL